MRIASHARIVLPALLFCLGCSRDRSVSLTLDFSRAQTWRYAVDARVTGTVFAAETGQRGFESAAQCTLLGTADAKNSAILHVTVPYAHFSSNILAGAELENLVAQSREVRLRCNLSDGAIAPEDTAEVPMIRIGEWDVFADLAKAVPALPKIRVKPGASWDREKTIPLDTRHGSAAGHLVQSFRLDSVYTGPLGKPTARVGWTFFYRIEPKGRDLAAAVSGLIDRLPQKGSGTGTALINVNDRSLESASMTFSVSEAGAGKFRISWEETILMHRVY